MNNFVNTEKSLKRWLKTKVKVTMATVVGFLIAGTVVMGAGTVPKDGVYTNDVLLNTLKSTKFAVGQNGNLEIYSNGSVGYLLSDLQKDHSLSGIQNALSQQNNHPGYVVLTGALAGEGNYDSLTSFALGMLSNKGGTTGNLAKALKRFDTISAAGNDQKVEGDVTTIIGDEKNSPVVLSLIGGDFNANIFADKTSLERTTGNTSVTINNGNVFGATAGSVSVATGNMIVNYEKIIKDKKINSISEIALNGNTTLNINNGANAAGVTAGGIAAAIGGTAVSTVNGNSNIVVNSVVNGDRLEGITAGLFGGGMAVSTLGGTASTDTTGKTDVTIKDGLSVGVAGGGLAFATDASQYLKANQDDGSYKIEKGGATVTISKEGLNNGGTSKVTSGDINVKLNGTTSAAVVVGNGLAVSHQNSPQGTKPTETDKISTSTVEANDITVNVNLTKK